MSDEFDNEATSAGDVSDVRLYVVDPAEWKACIKQDSEKMYCYQKNPGEDYFHLIINGEVYLVRGDEKLCLRCALREGIATTDRLFWQHRVKPKKSSPL
jgi:hypothetical protein